MLDCRYVYAPSSFTYYKQLSKKVREFSAYKVCDWYLIIIIHLKFHNLINNLVYLNNYFVVVYMDSFGPPPRISIVFCNINNNFSPATFSSSSDHLAHGRPLTPRPSRTSPFHYSDGDGYPS